MSVSGIVESEAACIKRRRVTPARTFSGAAMCMPDMISSCIIDAPLRGLASMVPGGRTDYNTGRGFIRPVSSSRFNIGG